MDSPYLFLKFKYIVIFTKRSFMCGSKGKKAYVVLIGKGNIQFLGQATHQCVRLHISIATEYKLWFVLW